MRKRKTKTEIHIRFSKRCENEIRSSKPFFKVSRKRKTKSKIQICFSMSCENEKWKWHLNSLFPCHRKTVGTKVHALFSKLNVQSITFSKFPHEIEAAAICFPMERGLRKSRQNSRICVRAQIKLVYPV